MIYGSIKGILTSFRAKLLAWPYTRALTASFFFSFRFAFILKVYSKCSLLRVKLSSSSVGWVHCSFSSSLSSMTSHCTSSSSFPTTIAKYTTRNSSCLPLNVVIAPSVGNLIYRYRILVATSKSYNIGQPKMALYTSGNLTTKNCPCWVRTVGSVLKVNSSLTFPSTDISILPIPFIGAWSLTRFFKYLHGLEHSIGDEVHFASIHKKFLHFEVLDYGFYN